MIYCTQFPGTKLSYHPQSCLVTEQNASSPPAVLVTRRASCRCIMPTTQRAKKTKSYFNNYIRANKNRGRKKAEEAHRPL